MMHRMQVYITDEQYNFLQQQSEAKHLTMAEYLRNIIDNSKPSENEFKKNKLFTIGQREFKMNRKNGSEKHDQYVYGKKK